MELIIVPIAIFLNFWLLYWKVTNHRVADAVLDITMMILLAFMFGGTASGMAFAMAGGALISIGLLIYPPDLDRIFGSDTIDTNNQPGTTYPDWYHN